MKKGLSILLVAAALFGFYGGAVNLNDVLACKDYWEEENEKTTADLNKLEDGLNQLKDNEQAYLDGLDAVADGEEALAEGEADYAEGQATLAQGEADYAAAPGQLAAARKQIAKGEADLAAGEKKLADGYADYDKGQEDLAAGKKALAAGKKGKSDLEKLISGLQNAKTQYDNAWKPGFEKKATKSDYSDAGLAQARQVITQTLSTDENKKSIALIEQLTGAEDLTKNLNNDASYASFDKGVNGLISAFSAAKQALTSIADLAKDKGTDTDETKALKTGLSSDTAVPVSDDATAPISSLTLAQTEAVLEGAKAKVSAGEKSLDSGKQALAALNQMKEAGATTVGEQMGAALQMPAATPIGIAIAGVQKKVDDGEAELKAGKTSVANLTALVEGRKQAASEVAQVVTGYGDKLALVGALDPRLAQLGDLMKAIAGTDMKNGEFATSFGQMQGGLLTLADTLETMIAEKIDPNVASFKAWDNGYQQLADGQALLSDADGGLPFAFSTMLSNTTIRPVLNEKAPALIPALQLYSTKKLANDDLDDFNSDMSIISANVIPNALQILQAIKAEVNKQLSAGEKELAAGRTALAQGEKDLAAGEKELAAGKAKLAAGKKQYAEGLANYKAAPAKLAEGRAQLAEGLQKLMDGRADLAAGKEKLAEYEDGEQQVRDGLATLMGTEAHGGLTSILDRRDGDDEFDDPNGHLGLDEGLEAVTTGREYQADTGTLVTKEITNRAVGAAAGLGAGALAVLAAILSFLKKNKGAGVSAILAAAAGGAGIAYGTSAGMEFSNIAGSSVSSVPMIAAGVLAAVALVHAIAHFAAKEA